MKNLAKILFPFIFLGLFNCEVYKDTQLKKVGGESLRLTKVENFDELRVHNDSTNISKYFRDYAKEKIKDGIVDEYGVFDEKTFKEVEHIGGRKKPNSLIPKTVQKEWEKYRSNFQ